MGFDQPRSPGSALKPFIYALGIDRGLVLQRSQRLRLSLKASNDLLIVKEGGAQCLDCNRAI